MKLLITTFAALLSTGALGDEAQSPRETPFRIYSSLDMFAYSEPVSIDAFARNFDDNLESGDTAFTHNEVEIGLRWRNYSIAVVHRFDYLTEFTPDTAFFHHSSKNRIPIDQNRQFDLLLDVERINATGIKAGYAWQAHPQVALDFAFTWYPNANRLQSGSARVNATEQFISPEKRAEFDAFISSLEGSGQDFSPLYDLIADVDGLLQINYAYNVPKFREATYTPPNLVGDPNPPLTGVDFTAPDGTGYALDIGVTWQVNPRLTLGLAVKDAINEFEWDNAPQTDASFRLNPFLNDLVGVLQDFNDGAVVFPNELIDRHWLVNIRNETYRQRLPARADLTAAWQTGYRPDFWGWRPRVDLHARYYHTRTQAFPRLGVSLDAFKFEYDIAASAFAFGWSGRYLEARLITDDFDLKSARTFGVSVSLGYGF